MTEGEFPFRSFTMRAEGYDRSEVDGYVGELQTEIVELRRAVDTATMSGGSTEDVRLHDPEGAVTRTLAIAQETADRVLHDAQVEADSRRTEADEHATATIDDADERAARLLAEVEAQAAEVREQGVAAARSAITVERDKAMAELALVRRVRDDLRAEAVDLKAALDRYRTQAREASDSLAAAASGPMLTLDLPDFVDDEVILAGLDDERDEAPHLRSVEPADDDWDDADDVALFSDDDDDDRSGAYVDAEPAFIDSDDVDIANDSGSHLAEVIAIDSDPNGDGEIDFEVASDLDDDVESGSGAFLSEVRAAADEDDVPLVGESDESDRFLSELRGLSEDPDSGLDSEAADTFFDD